MGSGDSWSLTARPCDACKAAPSAVFCSSDSAFLCGACDGRVHAVNRVASRHARVPVCEVCEHAPAAVTCKADAAALCRACDRDIHSANPLARRHERLPVVPIYDAAGKSSPSDAGDEFSEEEAEAASWLLSAPNNKPGPDPGSPVYKTTEYLFGDSDPDLTSGSQKQNQSRVEHNKQCCTDGVVPVQQDSGFGSGQYPGQVFDGYPAYDVDCMSSKPFMYNFTSQSICQSVCSDIGVVPEHNGMGVADASKTEAIPSPLSGVDREARVLRYRAKRKNRKFEKTIRYASRKAYAETRPRIKGRFAKRSEPQVESLLNNDAAAGYGVVPTFLSAVAN